MKYIWQWKRYLINQWQTLSLTQKKATLARKCLAVRITSEDVTIRCCISIDADYTQLSLSSSLVHLALLYLMYSFPCTSCACTVDISIFFFSFIFFFFKYRFWSLILQSATISWDIFSDNSYFTGTAKDHSSFPGLSCSLQALGLGMFHWFYFSFPVVSPFVFIVHYCHRACYIILISKWLITRDLSLYHFYCMEWVFFPTAIISYGTRDQYS